MWEETASTSDELRNLQGRLHDIWFEMPSAATYEQPTAVNLGGVDERVSDEAVRTFGPVTLSRTFRLRVNLRIRAVLKVEVTDSAEIDQFNLQELTWSQGENVITIVGGVPVTVRLHVASLDVSCVFGDDRIVGRHRVGLRH